MPPEPLPLLLVSSDSALRAALRRRQRTALVPARRILGRLQGGGVVAVVSVRFCTNASIRGLNRRWFGRTGATNVMSFTSPVLHAAIGAHGPVPLRAGALGRWLKGLRGEVFLGDIALSLERADAEARAAGLDPGEWAAALLVHGLLHLLGYTHRTMPLDGMPSLPSE
jgi:rRNA maturation RNase YbeY